MLLLSVITDKTDYTTGVDCQVHAEIMTIPWINSSPTWWCLLTSISKVKYGVCNKFTAQDSMTAMKSQEKMTKLKSSSSHTIWHTHCTATYWEYELRQNKSESLNRDDNNLHNISNSAIYQWLKKVQYMYYIPRLIITRMWTTCLHFCKNITHNISFIVFSHIWQLQYLQIDSKCKM